MQSSPFDQMADDYDSDFTADALGATLRKAVWRRLERHVVVGGRALDLGCGTGEDARGLCRKGMAVVAVDSSSEMVAKARAKLSEFGPTATVSCGEIGRLDDVAEADGLFDLVLSNFGALNCVHDLRSAFSAIVERMQPNGVFVPVIMGPVVPWEWLLMVGRGRPSQAWRRMRRGGTTWRGIRVTYPGPSTVTRAAEKAGLRVAAKAGLGTLLPTTEGSEWIGRRPRLLAALDRLERTVESWPGVPRLADHVIYEMLRR